MFPVFTCQDNFNPTVLEAIRSHLQALQTSLKYYFPDLNGEWYDWVRNTFTSKMPTNDCEVQQEAVKLKTGRSLQLKFRETEFGCIYNKCPRISTKPIEVLLQCLMVWVYEHGFSTLTYLY